MSCHYKCFLLCPVFCYYHDLCYALSSVIMIFSIMCCLPLLWFLICSVSCYYGVFCYVLSSVIMMYSVLYCFLLLWCFLLCAVFCSDIIHTLISLRHNKQNKPFGCHFFGQGSVYRLNQWISLTHDCTPLWLGAVHLWRPPLLGERGSTKFQHLLTWGSVKFWYFADARKIDDTKGYFGWEKKWSKSLK